MDLLYDLTDPYEREESLGEPLDMPATDPEGLGRHGCSTYEEDLEEYEWKWKHKKSKGKRFKVGKIEHLLPEIREVTGDELANALNQARQELYPGKTRLTQKEADKVYNRMNEILGEK